MLATTPEPPYYSVIFASEKTESEADQSAYDIMASQMLDLAAQQPGYLGVETIENDLGHGITVSYWESMDAIKAWRDNPDHLAAQKLGKEVWYERYSLRIAKVEWSGVFSRRTRLKFLTIEKNDVGID
jgi:heme-degrading monooxygenase HmoA